VTRRTLVWIAAGIFLYAVFMMNYLPAAWVGKFVERVTEKRINVVAPTGTLWRGQGSLVVILPDTGATTFGMLTWDLRIPYLLLAQLRTDIALRDGPLTAKFSVVRTIGELRVQALHGQASASRLAKLYPPLRVANLQGEFQLDAESVRLTNQGLIAQADLLWQNAGSGSFGLETLGDYRATFAGGTQPMQIDVSTLRGDVIVSGKGQWETATDGRFQLSLTIDPQKRQSTLGPLIQSWTHAVGAGRYRYEINTVLPAPRLGSISGS